MIHPQQSRLPVINYVAEEVSRQGHDIDALDGIERVGWMLNAWAYALTEGHRKPEVSDALLIGKLIERRKNNLGFRKVKVWVGRRECPAPTKVPSILTELFARRDELSPFEFYRAFEECHPFIDGNGRTGKVLLNWLNETLLEPEFPPNDFWGREIRNP